MLDGLTPDLAPRLVLAIGGVGVALVILVLVLIFLKRRNSPLFIKGGKSREARLLVLDAAAVDPKRRLVLIRRDEVEHLIMIGGPTDIVIESGITDRARAATSTRSIAVDEPAVPRPIAAPVAETRQTPPAAERRQEPMPARPVPVQPERPAPPVAEARVAAPAARPAVPPVDARERPSVERHIERPPAARQPDTRNVSAMGSILYGEDREPMTGSKPSQPLADTAATEPVAKPVTATPAHAEPVRTAAEAALDAARDRVLPNQEATASTPITATDAEKALAARAETMRRVHSAQAAAVAPAVTRTAAEPTAQRTEPQLEPPKAKDAEPSDFEKLLEAELDASGVFGNQAPQVRGDVRVTNAVATNAVAPPVRVTPPITGASPDVTSEEEVARLLGEIAVNRKA